ncbi:hypothetical protein [Citrobacter gillenii]|uniref:hypothetical protein n=1 Tax=Citrobacter gillenii TaxID=67828 RepID=UPI003986C2E2
MWSELLSGLIGAFVGGFFTLCGTIIEGRRQKGILNNELVEKQRGALVGIKTEIVILMDLYKSRMSQEIDDYDGVSPFGCVFPLSQNYFSFYESNSMILTSLEECTMKSIVSFYGSARSLVDTYKMNNEAINDLFRLQTIYYETNLEIHKFNWENSHRIATEYGSELKKIHNEVMVRVEDCLIKIDQEIISMKKK